jgi:SAM-dependent methyltransferase
MDQPPQKNRGWSAEEYAALAAFDGEWRDLWWNQDFLELMAVRWRLSDVRSVLDVGCGAGHWGQMLATVLPKDARIVGVDHESGFLETARERARARCLPQQFEYHPRALSRGGRRRCRIRTGLAASARARPRIQGECPSGTLPRRPRASSIPRFGSKTAAAGEDVVGTTRFGV